jgi:hypothetical protein
VPGGPAAEISDLPSAGNLVEVAMSCTDPAIKIFVPRTRKADQSSDSGTVPVPGVASRYLRSRVPLVVLLAGHRRSGRRDSRGLRCRCAEPAAATRHRRGSPSAARCRQGPRCVVSTNRRRPLPGAA